ncbi:MAG: hypothetical protein P1P88_11485 [Bacteroidales bacterium]|nr:hypothetical protein [Bacteroidales bacterium]
MTSLRKPPGVSKNIDTPMNLYPVCIDIVYSAPFGVINKTIQERKSYPSIFTFVDETGIIINGSWLSWQIRSFTGENKVQVTCIVESGTIFTIGQEGDLTGTRIILELNLDELAAAEPLNNYNSSKSAEIGERPLAEKKREKTSAIALVEACYPGELSFAILDILDIIFLNYFNENIADFNRTLAFMLIDKISKSNGNRKYKLINFKYVLEIPRDARNENSFFGLIAKVQKEVSLPSKKLEAYNCII